MILFPWQANAQGPATGITVFAADPLTAGSAGPSYTLSGPASTRPGVAATFTVTPSVSVTDTVTIAVTGSATRTPTSLSWSASAAPQTFTVTDAVAESVTITLTSGASYAVAGSPATLPITNARPKWFPGLSRRRRSR